MFNKQDESLTIISKDGVGNPITNPTDVKTYLDNYRLGTIGPDKDFVIYLEHDGNDKLKLDIKFGEGVLTEHYDPTYKKKNPSSL